MEARADSILALDDTPGYRGIPPFSPDPAGKGGLRTKAAAGGDTLSGLRGDIPQEVSPVTPSGQTVRHRHNPSLPQVKGPPAPPQLRHGASGLMEGAGLLLLQRLWDRFRHRAFLETSAERGLRCRSWSWGPDSAKPGSRTSRSVWTRGSSPSAMGACPQDLGTPFLWEIPHQHGVRGALGPMYRPQERRGVMKDPTAAIRWATHC